MLAKKLVILKSSERPALDLDFSKTPQIDSRLTFTRNITATCKAYAPTAAAGDLPIVTVCSANEARFNNARRISQDVWSAVLNDGSAIPLPITLLAEEARTNSFIYSNDLTQTTTSTGNISGTVSKTANTLHLGATAGDFLYIRCGVQTANTTFTIQILLSGTGTIKLYLAQRDSNTTGLVTVTLTSTPTKYTITASNGAGTDIGYTGLLLQSNGSAADITCSSWQIEAASNASSYIPTTTVAITRAADSLSFTGAGLNSWYNSAQGTFAITASGSAFNAPYNLGALALTYASQTKYLLGYNNNIKNGSTYLYTAATLGSPVEYTGVSVPTTVYVNSGGIANISKFTYYPKALKATKMGVLL